MSNFERLNLQDDGAIVELRSVSLTAMGRDRPVPILDHVDLKVRRGELVCVVGPSGCGKSTILNAIAGVRLPGEIDGEILLDGKPRQPYDRSIGYMVQQDTLLPWRTTAYNVRLAAKLGGHQVDVEGLLASVGLQTFGDFYPAELSGGMRKRAQLARLLAQDPNLLLMDEPFSAVDFLTRTEIHEVFLNRWEELGCGIVFVTHDLDEALALADRVLVMSPRPARVVAELSVNLPRPRPLRELVNLSEYRDLHQELWSALAKNK